MVVICNKSITFRSSIDYNIEAVIQVNLSSGLEVRIMVTIGEIVTGKGHQAGFWAFGSVLFFDLGTDCMDAFTL